MWISHHHSHLPWICYQPRRHERKVKAVREWLVPRTVQELQRVLGFASFYRWVIRQFSIIAPPLNTLLKGATKRITAPTLKLTQHFGEMHPVVYISRTPVLSAHWSQKTGVSQGYNIPEAWTWWVLFSTWFNLALSHCLDSNPVEPPEPLDVDGQPEYSVSNILLSHWHD